MSLKIFLTSDVHLGMKFAGYPEVQSELTKARFSTLENLVQKANNANCNIFAVAGDLFDRVSVSKSDVIRAAQILSEFQGNIVTVLPGNHDYFMGGQNDLWNIFKENSGDNVLVLEEKRIEPLQHYDIDVNIYPAPCNAKHSNENCIDWIRDIPKDENVPFHIGMAHGSMEGFSPDFDKKYYPMLLTDLHNCELDIWLLGHTHIQYPMIAGQKDKIFYPATPEPDGFDCAHEGKAWIIEFDDSKNISSTSISTGTYQFLHDEVKFNTISDLEKSLEKYITDEYANVLLKLKLIGRIPIEEYINLPQLRGNVEEHLLYLYWDDSEVFEKITPDIIDREFTEDSFPHKLLSILAEDDENPEALQIAYGLINEVRE